jgi:uncharacterized membrane protein
MSQEEVDPADTEDPVLGHGLFEEDMGPGSAMAHLYRGEIHRMKLWRERLDRTTNWAVMMLAAILTWAFSDPGNPHYLVLVGMVALTIFLGIEAHRYRGYDVWRSRVRLLQENVIAPGLDPSAGVDDPDWRQKLARDYRAPTIKLTFEEALAHRLRRVYLPLLTVLVAAWVVRITAFPNAGTWPTTAAVGGIPGTVVTGLVVVGYLCAALIAFRPRTWRSRAELRERHLEAWDDSD